jgi:hypothetical protein
MPKSTAGQGGPQFGSSTDCDRRVHRRKRLGAIPLPEEPRDGPERGGLGIVEHFQWLTEEQSKDLPPGKLAEIRQEISDVMVYLAELVDKLGVDPVEAARAKLEINERKYPAGLVRGPALRRRRLRHPAP